MQLNGPLVMQFAKLPVLGSVKTRLAKTIGKYRALEVHVELLQEVYFNLSLCPSSDYELWLSHSPETKESLGYLEFLPPDINVKIQLGKDLGERMAHALITALSLRKSAMIVGSDCPGVKTPLLDAAANILNKCDLVFIPSEDGGYVLVGASRFSAGLFEGVEWGSEKVLEQTLSNARQLGFSYKCMAGSWDVDDIHDYERWLEYKNN